MHTSKRSAVLVLSLILWYPVVARGQQHETAQCELPRSLTQLTELPEASGLALSAVKPGRLWTHNDSGEPVLFAIDARGLPAGQVRVTGAKIQDLEAIAVAPCQAGSCIYLADIGDNDAKRERISIYQVPEPQAATGTAAVTAVFHATYPDGAHDAETLLLFKGRAHIVTKGETGPVAIYRFPETLKNGDTVQLERVTELAPKASAEGRVTDGSVSPDGNLATLRSRTSLSFYRASDLQAGQAAPVSTVDLTPLKEPQGEGVALGSKGAVYLVGEGGSKGRPGTFAQLSCASRGD